VKHTSRLRDSRSLIAARPTDRPSFRQKHVAVLWLRDKIGFVAMTTLQPIPAGPPSTCERVTPGESWQEPPSNHPRPSPEKDNEFNRFERLRLRLSSEVRHSQRLSNAVPCLCGHRHARSHCELSYCCGILRRDKLELSCVCSRMPTYAHSPIQSCRRRNHVNGRSHPHTPSSFASKPFVNPTLAPNSAIRAWSDRDRDLRHDALSKISG